MMPAGWAQVGQELDRAEAALAVGDPQAVVALAPALIRGLRLLRQADASAWRSAEHRREAVARLGVRLQALQTALVRAQAAVSRERQVLLGGGASALVYDEAGRPRGTAPLTTQP